VKHLLDTCVISELVSRRPNAALIEWVDRADEERLYLSVITISEIKKGICKLADSEHKRALTQWLEVDLHLRFKDRILPIEARVMLVWGELPGDAGDGLTDCGDRPARQSRPGHAQRE
jgi:predicted nucleic acid-binding protein